MRNNSNTAKKRKNSFHFFLIFFIVAGVISCSCALFLYSSRQTGRINESVTTDYKDKRFF